jgi:hypothetical protein
MALSAELNSPPSIPISLLDCSPSNLPAGVGANNSMLSFARSLICAMQATCRRLKTVEKNSFIIVLQFGNTDKSMADGRW